MYFQNFGLQNTLLDKYLKSRLSQDHSKGNMGSVSKHCCNPNQTTFIISIDHSEGNWIVKKSFLAISKILRLFVNTLTADEKYSLINRDTLTQPVQMQLYQKQKTFSWFFSAFLKSIFNFGHFWKNDESHIWHISKITNSEKRR